MLHNTGEYSSVAVVGFCGKNKITILCSSQTGQIAIISEALKAAMVGIDVVNAIA